MVKKKADNARGKAGAGRGTRRTTRNSQQAAATAAGQAAQKQQGTVSRRGKASNPSTSRDASGENSAGEQQQQQQWAPQRAGGVHKKAAAPLPRGSALEQLAAVKEQVEQQVADLKDHLQQLQEEHQRLEEQRRLAVNRTAAAHDNEVREAFQEASDNQQLAREELQKDAARVTDILRADEQHTKAQQAKLEREIQQMLRTAKADLQQALSNHLVSA